MRLVLCILLALSASGVGANNTYDPSVINDFLRETWSNFMIFLEDLFAKADFSFERCEIPPGIPVDRSEVLNQVTNLLASDNDRFISFYIKKCQYRDKLLAGIFYKWYTGHGCYIYTQPSLFKPYEPKPVIGTCRHNSSYDSLIVPCFVIKKLNSTVCYPIDSKIPEVLDEIKRTLISIKVVDRWVRCTEAAMDCCNNVMTDENVKPSPERCTAVWDGWKCWDPIGSGNVSEAICPEFAFSQQPPSCNHFSSKTCYENGTWAQQTYYDSCWVSTRLLARTNTHILFLGITIAITAPAVIIMIAYRRLRIHRLALHRNLLIAILLRSIFVLISKSVVYINELTHDPELSDSTIMDRNNFACKFLAILEKTAASAVFATMLVDGVFMHRRIVGIFKKDLNITLVYSLAAVSTIIPVAVWIVLMALYNNQYCWMVYTVTGISWALDGPRVVMLFINTVLLIDILRIIFTKVNRKENAQQLSTAKTTIFLMPLFGVQFIFTAWVPNFESCVTEHWYFTLIFLLESLQGILVAVFYCYANKEVHRLVLATYKKAGSAVSNKLNSSVSQTKRATMSNLAIRRGTLSTMVSRQTSIMPNAVLLRFSSNSEAEAQTDSIRNANRTPNTPRHIEFGNTLFVYDNANYSPDEGRQLNISESVNEQESPQKF